MSFRRKCGPNGESLRGFCCAYFTSYVARRVRRARKETGLQMNDDWELYEQSERYEEKLDELKADIARLLEIIAFISEAHCGCLGNPLLAGTKWDPS